MENRPVGKTQKQILIVAFDALRPDMVTPELMPNLTQFANDGVRFSHSRSTFPTETRVNQTATITGCYPNRHGIVGNKFMDTVAAPDKLFNTGDEDALAAGDRRLHGRLLDVPALGEILADNDLNLAVISAGTPGGTRILHHRAEQLDGFRLSLHRPDASVPAARIAEIQDRLGPIPPHEIPSLSWLTYATDCYLDYVEPELKPDVMILWYCEPDNSYHHKGLGSPDNLAAMRHADDQFGRILAARDNSDLGEHLQILTLSDHGQLTVSGPALDLAAKLRQAGYSVGPTVNPEDPKSGELALALDSAGGIYVRNSNPDRINAVVGWLQKQDWCGPVFTKSGDGCLRLEHIGLDHRRAPDIALALASNDSLNAHGVAGTTRHDSGYPDGGGLHGGLNPLELSTWLAMNGSAFNRQQISKLPTGLVDVLPTILEIFNLKVPEHCQGRILTEALKAHADDHFQTASEQTFSASDQNDWRAHITVSTVGATRYFERSWVD